MPELPLTPAGSVQQPVADDRPTVVVKVGGPAGRPAASDPPAAPPTVTICPYLLVPGAGWRAARPQRDHRCTAVSPLDAPTMETQRALCLTVGHHGCPRFQVAVAERRSHWRGRPEDLAAFEARVARRVPRATPVALDRPNAMVGPRAMLGGSRRLTRLALATIMVAAAVLLLAARFVGGGAEAGPPAPSQTASPERPAATARPTPRRTPAPTVTEAPASPSAAAP